MSKILFKVGEIFLLLLFIAAVAGCVVTGIILIVQQIHNTALGIFIGSFILAFIGSCVVLGREGY